ncbi:Hsp70 family protein [Glycomyces albidus]|uniref:Hsp70 family protein n=1 Tax=Glycomyces albidus TaxID=2656774 RepID=A0A6L5G8E4_9ACTN|nr:Hsp70 family protein [Glycomyces albidus]MQM25905.1 Hsp70 family protein [Glycomyces albidus]
MQHTPVATAIGVELGSSSVTLSIRRGDQESEIRCLDGEATLEAVLDRVRAARDEAGGAVPVGFAVPASWGPARRQELAYLAGEAGLGEVEIMAAPEAAAICYTEGLGRELAPGAGLAVCDLGARTFDVSVLVRGEEEFQHRASASTAEVGGREFDQLLFAYLSGRYRDTDPEFWDKVDAPANAEEEALRTALLGEIRAARELISKRPRAGVPLPVGERDLHLTRDEVESCIRQLVDQAADLVVGAIAEAGAAVTGLILVGGASRTPLLAAVLAERTGLEPAVPAFPEAALADGARIVALANAPAVEADGRPRRKAARRIGVLAAVLLPLVAAGAVFGNQLGGDDRPEASASTSPEPSPTPATSDTASSTDEAGGSGVGGQEAPGSPQAVASDEEEDEATASETADDSPEESATAGTVPEVTGMTANAAEDALNGAGFTEVAREGEQEGLFGPWYDDCEVIEQEPAAGEQHALGDPITITYSYSGSDPSVCD